MIKLFMCALLLSTSLFPIPAATASMGDEEIWVKLYPTDESAWDSSFYRFKQQLDQAIDNRDAEYIQSILDNDVYSSFGNESGIDAFMTFYDVENPESEFWAILKNCLNLGGTFRYLSGKKTFIAPYVFSRFPEEFDMYEYALVIGEEVPLHSSPDEDAELIKRLTHDVVYAVYRNPEHERYGVKKYAKNGFVWVKTLMDESGWIPTEALHCPLEHRVLFRKDGGIWRLTSLIEGD